MNHIDVAIKAVQIYSEMHPRPTHVSQVHVKVLIHLKTRHT